MEDMKSGLALPAVTRISTCLVQLDPNFKKDTFNLDAMEGLECLELKQRLNHIIEVLHRYLPHEFKQVADIFYQIPQHWDYGDLSDPIRAFAAWPIIDYVAAYGLEEPDIALPLLKFLTPLFSAEFAIRPFIIKYPEKSLNYFQVWVKDENEHVRRLVSEGSRPRLPWAGRITNFSEKPEAIIALLSALKSDPSLYVRRSVANHLNDIAKDKADLVIEICQKWFVGADDACLWLIKHATRGLVKAGDPRVFPLLGYTAEPQVNVSEIKLNADKLFIGDSLAFSFNLHSLIYDEQSAVIDYAIYFVKANGKHSPKVFKLKNIKLRNKQCLDLDKKHPFKIITTRRYYPGLHKLVILLNGKAVSTCTFELLKR